MTPERLAEIRAHAVADQTKFKVWHELLAEIDALTRERDEKTLHHSNVAADLLSAEAENARLTVELAEVLAVSGMDALLCERDHLVADVAQLREASIKVAQEVIMNLPVGFTRNDAYVAITNALMRVLGETAP